MDFMDSLGGRTDEEINADLIKPSTCAEVVEPLKQMHSKKALEPDGMSPIFYQKFWHIIGSSILDATIHALN